MTLRNCTLFPDDPHLCDVIAAVRKAMGSLSFVGCVFIITVIWLFKKYQIFTQRLILYLSIAAILDSISYLMPGLLPDGVFCDFQAFWLSVFDWAVLLWACCITFNLYFNAIKAVRTERFEIMYHVISWGVSLIVGCLPFIGDHYGPAGVWCWIDFKSSYSQIWRFMTWYIPLWVLLLAMLVTYIYIVVKLRREVTRWEGTYRPDDERHKEMLKKDIKRLKAYPLIYMALSVFPSVHRIHNAYHDKEVFWMMLLHAICSPLQGIVNALVFGFDRETLNLLTWTSIKDAFVQRTRFRSPLITEYSFAQTTGSSTTSASSSNTDPGDATRGNSTNANEQPASVNENKTIDHENPSTENVRERNTSGNNEKV